MIKFLIRLLGYIVAALFKHHLGDEEYSKVKTFFTIIAMIFSVIFIGYFLFFFFALQGYKGG